MFMVYGLGFQPSVMMIYNNAVVIVATFGLKTNRYNRYQIDIER